MMGALVLAGVMGSAIFRFSRIRQAGRRQTRNDRRAIWDSVDTNRDSDDRIAEMLERLSKGAAA
jgi:hypothetical protein